MKNYVATHLVEEKPDAVIIQCGGNDINTKGEDGSVLTMATIADDIMAIAHKARCFGTKHIMIGGVTMRSDRSFKGMCEELNNRLKALCSAHRFIYIDNGDILPTHTYDGVHLNGGGTKILADNYLRALRLRFNGHVTQHT